MIDWWGPVVSEYYGSTEGSIVSQITAEEWLDRPGSVGKAGAMSEITIRDDDGKVLPAGESGQIYVQQPDGHRLRISQRTGENGRCPHLEPGVFTFGDIGYFDEDGYLYLSDRKIDMIISGGVNIYPAEIEAVLVQHPAVEDAAVFGIPNEEFGEEVKAAVKLASGQSADDDAQPESHRLLPRAPGRLQGAEVHRLRGRVSPARDRQALQTAASRSLLAGPGEDNLMGLYAKYVLPKLIDAACGQPPMAELRSRYVPQAEGDVLEIGIGSGLNLLPLL